MSYRSLKRVLGETNLERKILLLFGTCLFAMLGLAFWSVDRIGERLVLDTTHRKGRDWAQTVYTKIHWDHWNTHVDKSPGYEKPEVSALYKKLMDPFQPSGVNFQVLGEKSLLRSTARPSNQAEEEILRRLEVKLRNQYALIRAEKEARATVDPAVSPEALPPQDAEFVSASANPVFEGLRSASDGKYYYYQPVYWSKDCLLCHEGMYGRFAVSEAETPLLEDPSMPFRVIKIVMPYDETRAAINGTRAILITVALLAVALSMLGLWLVVRYVINKPLAHLRDVSDEVSRGNLTLRADIHTNDEFEDLAASFNRMLRHLTDAQKELRMVNSDLDAKVDELAQLNMRLHEMNRLKGEFLANMSHELRTPLNSIIGFSDLLTNQEVPIEKRRRFAQNIQKSGRDLLDMINDILDLAKMEAGKMDIRLSEFHIDAIINAQCDLVRLDAEKKHIDLRLEIEDELPPLFQDQSKVQQILMNLMSNAVKFTPEGGRITVGAKGDGRGNIELWVADTGVGIAEADREIIFEKFRQAGRGSADNLTREYSGTGLGLSIVKELCRLLGGEITVESELGKGSTFRVVLPWMRTETVVSRERVERKEPPQPAISDLGASDASNVEPVTR